MEQSPTETLRLISEISTTLLKATFDRLEDAIKMALEKIGLYLNVDSTYLYLYSEDGKQVKRTFEWNFLGERRRTYRFSGMRLSPFLWSMDSARKGQSIILGNIIDLPSRAHAEKVMWQGMGIRALIGHPLFIHGGLLGYFGIVSYSSPCEWHSADINLSQFLGELLANALYRFRSEQNLKIARETELKIAAEIQQALLLKPIPEKQFPFELGMVSKPSLLIDGDFFDFYQPGSHHFDFILGDGMGKGVTAALLGAATKNQFLRAMAELRTGAVDRPPIPEHIMARVREEMEPQLSLLSTFVTVIYIRYHPASGRIRILNAGHPSVLHWQAATRKIVSYPSRNPPLGLMFGSPPQLADEILEEGDVLLFYSDGLTDARNAKKEFFGEEKLRQILMTDAPVKTPQEIVESILDNVQEFSGKSQQLYDDLTCFALRHHKTST